MIKLPSRHTTLFQRSSNVIWTLWMLDGRCFDVLCQVGNILLDILSGPYEDMTDDIFRYFPVKFSIRQFCLF